MKRKRPTAPAEQGLHRMFSVCTFLAFNGFFIYGGRPEINQWPLAAQLGFQAVVAIVSSLWLYRTWGRSREQYQKESLADKHRRQLQRLPAIDEVLGDRTLEQLSAEELSILAATLPQAVPAIEPKNHSLPPTILRRSPAPTAPLATTQIR